MLLRINHQTRLSYSRKVSGTIFEARMAPRSDDDQTALSYNLTSTPSAPVTSYRDGDGNRIDLFNIFAPYSQLSVNATSYVRTHRRDSLARLSTEPESLQIQPHQLSMELRELLKPSPLIPMGSNLLNLSESMDWSETESAKNKAFRILDTLTSRLLYKSDVTNAWTSVEEVLELNHGVCQDFAHVLIGLARIKGMPARYVSGYVYQPGQIATHAWAQVWFGPRIGWIDIDPTRNGFATDDHITVAYGRDYSDVPPNRGIWAGEADETIDVVVEISPIESLPSDNSMYMPRKSNQQNHKRQLASNRIATSSVSKNNWTTSFNKLAKQPFQPSSHPQQTQQQQQQFQSSTCDTRIINP